MIDKQLTVFLTETDQPYISGVLEASDEDILIDEEVSDALALAGSHIVDWRLDRIWKTEDSSTVFNINVQKHRLSKEGLLWFTYRLEVKVNASGKYKFTDRTGDVYELSVSLPSRIHYVDYNSSDPGIVLVEFKP